MTGLNIEIVRFVERYQPDLVECSLTDVSGAKHFFLEKVPVVTQENLTEASAYPRPGVIACVVLRRWHDFNGREIATINTDDPWRIESTNGQTQFNVLVSELIEI